MANILGVGIATLDYIFEVDHHPAEDEEMRAQSLRICRGGNATNTLTILAQLGHACTWSGVLAQSAQSDLIVQELQRYLIAHDQCPHYPGQPPTSSILLTPSGHRTIVHYRDLPELAFADFARFDLSPFDWLHFEARNIDTLTQMLRHARQQRPDVRISLEAEKPRPGLANVLHMTDFILASRALAVAWGEKEPREFLHTLRRHASQATLIAAWGADGAYALDQYGAMHHCPAFPPEIVVDTVGAGDTFNAGVINAVLKGQNLPQSLEHACRLAGRKCGLQGLLI